MEDLVYPHLNFAIMHYRTYAKTISAKVNKGYNRFFKAHSQLSHNHGSTKKGKRSKGKATIDFSKQEKEEDQT